MRVGRKVGVSTLIGVDSTGDESGGVSETGSSSVAGAGVAGTGGGGAAGAAVAGAGGGRAVGAAGAGGTVGATVCSLTCGINNSSPSSWADDPK